MIGLGRLIRLLGLFGALGFSLWLGGLIVFAENLQSSRPQKVVEADGIIVLTGGPERIGDGIRLLEEKRARRLFITGVNIQVSVDRLRKTWPGHEEAFDCCIDLDFRARNTIENALESAEWVRRQGFGSIILVTAGYHMPRALIEFAAAMPGVRIEPFATVPGNSRIEEWWREPALVRLLASEFTKYVLARLRIAVGL